jgi:N5-methyltetrahydromethanopterin:coenzyme M methyltransferase subunit G
MPEEGEKRSQTENEAIVSEYEEIAERLDRMDEKVEFVSAEVAQRTGRKIGREVGILYGIVAALILMLFIFIITNYSSFAAFIGII